MLRKAGFERIAVELKKESREYIREWLPGSGAEDYVVSAAIIAFKGQKKAADASTKECSSKC
jgi:hypothetical protein